MKRILKSATVLIVDDTPQNISLLNVALMEEYTIKVATSGIQQQL
jgi:response regulator RpfG family c-di-GMP phosphodiesterase